MHARTSRAAALIVCLPLQRTRAAARGLHPGLASRPQAGHGRQFCEWGRAGETLISTNPGARVCGVQGAAEGCGAPLNELMRERVLGLPVRGAERRSWRARLRRQGWASGPGPSWKFPRTWCGAESASGGCRAPRRRRRRGKGGAGRRSISFWKGHNPSDVREPAAPLPGPQPRATVMLQ